MDRVRRLAVLLVSAAFATGGCALMPRTHDYGLGITCLMVDQAGQPIDGAEVALELRRVAYRAVEPIREERRITPVSGGVVFMYITHDLSTPYVLTVRKVGYADGHARGVAPSGRKGTHLRITLVPTNAQVNQR